MGLELIQADCAYWVGRSAPSAALSIRGQHSICVDPEVRSAAEPSTHVVGYTLRMRREPIPSPPGWKMQVFEVVPGLTIATRLGTSTEYATLDVDAIVDLEDWEIAWVPPVPLGRLYLSFPIGDDDEVDPKVREVAAFIASLVNSRQRVLVHCTEGLNRSGIVVARALMEMGLSATDAIDLVRRQRGPSVDGFPALGNQAFVDWLQQEGQAAHEP